MGYEVHIVRSEEWWDEEGGGISLDEWIEYYVQNNAAMRLDGEAEAQTLDGSTIRYENEGVAVWGGYSGHQESGDKAWFDYRDGRVVVKNPDSEILRRMHEIASKSGAKVVGDEGEEYNQHGEVVDESRGTEDPGKKPCWNY